MVSKRKTKKRATRSKSKKDIMGISGMEHMMESTTETIGKATVGLAAIGLAGAIIGRI